MRYAKRYAGDLLLGYERARANGYSRSCGCFKRTASQLLRPEKKRRKRKNKPSQRAEYPGQKVQIDVRFVLSYCVAGGGKYYQFTAKDECTRWTYREMYDERSSVSAKDFLTCRGMRSQGQSQILCKLQMRHEQSRIIHCARQRIYPTAALCAV